MPIDDRAVVHGIRTTINKMGDPVRVLGDKDVDEIAGLYSQEELNSMVDNGVLAGNWTSTKKDAPSVDQKDATTGEPSREDLQAQIEELTRQLKQKESKPESKNDGESAQSNGASSFPEDYPGFDILGQVEGMNRTKLEALTDEKILEINGIGPATLKAIRSYKDKK